MIVDVVATEPLRSRFGTSIGTTFWYLYTIAIEPVRDIAKEPLCSTFGTSV